MVDKAFESHDSGATSVQPPARNQSFHSTLLLCMLALFPHFPGDGEVLLPCGSSQREEEGKEEHGMLLALAGGEQRPSNFVFCVQAKGQDIDTVESRCERQ